MENDESSQPQVAASILDASRLCLFRERLQTEQNLLMAVVAGFVAAVSGALFWAVMTVSTNLQTGYMAVGVGFLVGYTVRYAGRGLDTIYGVIGALMALAGCILGNLFSLVGFIANDEGLGYFQVLLGIDYSLVPSAMVAAFNPMDLLFYGIAIYEGYRFSFRHISDEELLQNAAR